jgi:hypothetical protein
MKRVAPTEIKGAYCSEGNLICSRLDLNAKSCSLYKCLLGGCRNRDFGHGTRFTKCPRCVDALAELEDR